MKREIKFRALDDGKSIYSSPFLTDSIDGYNYDLRIFFDQIRDDSILMQYTGLKDENGVEIYEGDVVTCYRYKNNEEHTVIIEDITKLPSVLYGSSLNRRRIIGNIYDNPDQFQ